MIMKNFWRFIACALVCAMLCTCFAACGGEDNKDGDDSSKSNGSDIYYIEYNGAKISLGAAADGILGKLGTPTSTKEIGDCGGLGAQVKYTYPSIVIYTLKTDDGETIDQVDVLDDLVETPKGIHIGSAKSDVESKYGTPASANDSSVQYVSGNKYLQFGISNGEVSSISLLRKTN